MNRTRGLGHITFFLIFFFHTISVWAEDQSQNTQDNDHFLHTQDPIHIEAFVDIENENILVGKKQVGLRPNEYKLLFSLFQDQGQPVSFKDLIDNIWGKDEVNKNIITNLQQHVSVLKKKIREVGEYIQSVPRVGYRLKEGLSLHFLTAYEFFMAKESTSPRDTLCLNGIEISFDSDNENIFIGRDQVRLKSIQYRFFLFLSNHLGRILSEEEIIGNVCGQGADVSKNTLKYDVNELKRKLGDFGRHIERVINTGYRLQQGAISPDQLSQETISYRNLRIDPINLWVFVEDDPLKFTRVEFEILFSLASNPGQFFSFEKINQIIKSVRGDQHTVSLRNLAVDYISSIKKKLGETGKYIETVDKRGYRLQEEFISPDQFNKETIFYRNLRIDPIKFLVFVDDNPRQLTQVEFEILFLLASNQGRVFTFEYLNEFVRRVSGAIHTSIWNKPVKRHIRSIRVKLKEIQEYIETIETIEGYGIRLQEEVVSYEHVSAESIFYNDIIIDPVSRRIFVSGKLVNLVSPAEFEILLLLMQNPGKVFSRASLMRAIGSYASSKNVIDKHIMLLRKELGEEHGQLIETVFGQGYRLRGKIVSPDHVSEEAVFYRDLVVDPVNGQAFVGRRLLDLTPLERKLLYVFVQNPGYKFSRDELIARIFRKIASDAQLNDVIINLRKKLGGAIDDYIVTVVGFGYFLR